MNRRSLRLKVVAGLGTVLALTLLTASSASAQKVNTETSLSVSTSDTTGQTKAAVQIGVTGADGTPASGAVAIMEGNRELAGAILDASGQATTAVRLPGGQHTLRAIYSGDSTHESSASATSAVTAQVSSTPSFQLSLTAVSPTSFPMVLTAGQTGTANVTVTPVNPTALTAPMFVTLSCSGLPNESSCTFSPASVEILSTTTTSCASGSTASTCPPVSSMTIQTQSQGTSSRLGVAPSPTGRQNGPVTWAFLLPGMIGLGGLAWGARRRRWLSRLALVALVGFVATLGTTACNPQYNYYHHGPPPTPATPSGTYTVTVTGQSTDGVTATLENTTFVLTVQ